MSQTASTVCGAVAVSATLSLPLALPHRQAVQTLAYGAIVVTLLVQGATMGSLVHWLGMERAADQGDPRGAVVKTSVPAPTGSPAAGARP